MAVQRTGAPLEVPATVLERRDFSAACAARDFGSVFVLLKRYAGVSQVRMAGALDMTPSRVGEVVRGQRRILSIEVIERISDRLRIPGRMLGLAPRSWEAVALASEPPVIDLRERTTSGTGEEPVSALDRLESLLSAPDPVGPVGGTGETDPTRAGRRVGADLVRRTRARLLQLRRLDDVVGGEDSAPIVTREVGLMADLLRDSSCPGRVRAELLGVLAELCQLAGWVLDDAGRHAEATRYYLTGARAADAAGEPALAATLLSTLSYQRANTGHTADAVLLARSAALMGARFSPPVGQALLWDRVAWAHACHGERDLSLRALERADEAFSSVPDEIPAWAYWLDRAELDVMAGRCLTRLGEPGPAEGLLAGAIEGYDESRAREVALYRSWLAEAHARGGDVERACAETMLVLDVAEGVRSARVDERIGVLREELGRFRGSAAVRDVEERSGSLGRSA